jgi:membrane protein
MRYKLVVVLKDMIYRFKDDGIPALSSQLAYSILASFFPFLIFLLTLAPFLNVNENEIIESLRMVLPGNSFELVQKIISEVLNRKSTNLLSFSLLLSIWSASAGIRAVIIGLNKAYDEEEKRAFYIIWAISIIGIIALAFTITLSFVLLIFGGSIGDYLQCCYKLTYTVRRLWDILRIILAIMILVMLFSAAYYFLPARKLRWKEVLPGSFFCTFGWIIASYIFSYYVNNYGNYSRFYGSIGAVFALMTWLYISAEIIILGGELNASLIYNRRQGKFVRKSNIYRIK